MTNVDQSWVLTFFLKLWSPSKFAFLAQSAELKIRWLYLLKRRQIRKKNWYAGYDNKLGRIQF